MYYVPLEKPQSAKVANGEPKHGLLLGVIFLAIALPYWGGRLFAQLLARDVRRLARLVRLCGATYAETLRQR